MRQSVRGSAARHRSAAAVFVERALSVSDAEWDAFRARHTRRPTSDLVVDEVRIENTSPLSDEIVAKIDRPEPLSHDSRGRTCVRRNIGRSVHPS